MMKPEQLRYSILKKAFSGQLVKCESKSDDKPKVKTVEYDETPFDIPDDWFWSNLGSCCDMYTGNSISESVKKAKYAGLKEGYDYIATKDVSFTHTIKYDNGVRIPVDDGFKIAYCGSVLMCIEGGSAGRKIGVLDRDVCFGNKLCSFNSTEIVNAYIYYYLQSHEFKAFFKDNMSGIIGGVSIKKLKELPIPVPTVSEQKAIVKKIEELLPYVDRYAEAFEKLEKFNAKFPEDIKKSILQYAVQGKLVEQRSEEGTGDDLYQKIKDEKHKQRKIGEEKKEKTLPAIVESEIPFEIPVGWRWVRLMDILVEKPTNGYSPKGVDYVTNYRNLTLTATTSGCFRYDAFKYVDISFEEADKYWLKHNDILIQRSNSRELVGTSCLYDGEDDQYIYPDLMMRLHIVPDIDVKYIDYVLKSPYVRQYYSRSASGTSESMPKINQSIVASTVIPLPPISEQKRIVKMIDELLPYCDRLVK